MSVKRLSQETAKELIGKYNAELKALDFQVSEIKATLKELGAHHAKLKKASDAAAAKKAKKAAAVAKKKAAAAKKKAAAAAKKKAAAAKKKAAAAAKRKAAAAKKKAAAAAKKAKKAAKKPARKAAPKKATAKRGRKKAVRKAAPKKRVAKKAVRKAAPKKRVAKKATSRKSSGGSRGRKMSYSDWDMLVMNTLKGAKAPVRTSTLLDAGAAHAKKAGGKSDEKFVRAKVAAALQKLVNKTKEVKKVPAKGRGFSYKLK